MLKKIVETTAVAGLSNVASRKLFKLESGPYAGRMLAFFQTSDGQIVLTFADKPYTTWSEPIVVATDSSGFPFDTVVDVDGNAHLLYTEQSSYSLVTKKMSFSSGVWTVGSKVYVYNGTIALMPSVTIGSDGTLWACWSQLASGYYDIRCKASTDNGATWGTGSSDPGELIRAGLPGGQTKILIRTSDIFIIYTGTGTDLFCRSRALSGGEWSTEYTIATGEGVDSHFDAAVSSDGLLGVAFDAGMLRYREFDGSNWNSVVTVDESEASFPQLLFAGNVPIIVYLSEFASGQIQLKYVHRQTGVFSEPEILDGRANSFDSVLLYHAGSSSYSDRSLEAASAASADLFHPSSGSLVSGSGDSIYLGMDQPFRCMTLLLSTPGAGGTVAYSYFDGSNWLGFTPAGGGYNFDSNQRCLLLWTDLSSVPQNWQKCEVDGISRYWVKAEVVSSFASAPVGSRATAFSKISALACGR